MFVYYCVKKVEKYLHLTKRLFLLYKGTCYSKACRFLQEASVDLLLAPKCKSLTETTNSTKE